MKKNRDPEDVPKGSVFLILFCLEEDSGRQTSSTPKHTRPRQRPLLIQGAGRGTIARPRWHASALGAYEDRAAANEGQPQSSLLPRGGGGLGRGAAASAGGVARGAALFFCGGGVCG